MRLTAPLADVLSRADPEDPVALCQSSHHESQSDVQSLENISRA